MLASDKTTKLLNKMRKREQVTQKLTPIGSEIIMPNLSGLKAAAARQGLGLQEVTDTDPTTTNDLLIIKEDAAYGLRNASGVDWSITVDSSGNWYVRDVDNNKYPVRVRGNTPSDTLTFSGATAVVGIGVSTGDASSKLDVTSTTKGFLPPRMTTVQKNAISSPATGLVVYDTTLNKLCVYTGAAWETVTSA